VSRTFCGGCGAEGEPVEDGFCFECRTYFKAGHVVAINLCAWLERWRKRHNLSRAEAVKVARQSLEINSDILEAAMGGEDVLTD
jgi:NMD protein affecting ribosome stability and mRNA decay